MPKRDVVSSAFRGGLPRGPSIPLARAPAAGLTRSRHAGAGVSISRCARCGGAFAEHEALVAIESYARRTTGGPSLRGAVTRAYETPTEDMACPSCAGETTRREWSIGTLVFVDVCVECRGVWLDGGELEALGG